MQLSTTLLPREDQATSDRISSQDTAIVIDVLRATSVMCTALHHGADRMITCREVSRARGMTEQYNPRPLLCGERGCRPIAGFDFGNSPAEYRPDRVTKKTLILTTTNGTRAIEFASPARQLITASFLNLAAVLDFLSIDESIHIVCAGTEGEVTAEDTLLAGALVKLCETQFQAEIQDDDSLLARQLWCSWFPEVDPRNVPSSELSARLRETRGGKNLINVGYEADLSRCAAVNSISTVPVRVEQNPVTFVSASRSASR